MIDHDEARVVERIIEVECIRTIQRKKNVNVRAKSMDWSVFSTCQKNYEKLDLTRNNQ